MITKQRSPHKKAIFFDVNQTLLRQERSFQACFQSQWSAFTARWSSDSIPSAEDVWLHYFSRLQKLRKTRMSAAEMEELQRRCLTEAMTKLSVPASAGMVRSLLQAARREQLDSAAATPHAVTALRYLAPKHQLAIISNSPRSEVTQSLRKNGLADFFPQHRIFTPASASEKKPSSHLFRAAMESMKLTPRQAVMVGNSWKHDVTGAVRAGLDAVWIQAEEAQGAKKISRHKLGKRNVYMIHRLDQLIDLLP